MCWIAVKEEGQKFDMNKVKKAQKFNEDGYGLLWWEDNEIQVFKTLNFNKFLALASTLKDNKAILHLRRTSRGDTCSDNIHPFAIPSGYFVHNGTVSSMDRCSSGGSDTKKLAELINECKYEYIEDIQPLIKSIIGTTINRLAFLEDDGKITIINKGLGMVEGGIWYSNDYHKRNLPVGKSTTTRTKTITSIGTTTRVFVYGTLKKGYHNHESFLDKAKFIGNAISVSKWTMIGEGMGFPYLLERSDNLGNNIKGEVYEVTADELKNLDYLEGVPTHYRKSYMYVSYIDGTPSGNVTVYVKTNVTALDNAKKFISEFEPKKQLSLVGKR